MKSRVYELICMVVACVAATTAAMGAAAAEPVGAQGVKYITTFKPYTGTIPPEARPTSAVASLSPSRPGSMKPDYLRPYDAGAWPALCAASSPSSPDNSESRTMVCAARYGIVTVTEVTSTGASTIIGEGLISNLSWIQSDVKGWGMVASTRVRLTQDGVLPIGVLANGLIGGGDIECQNAGGVGTNGCWPTQDLGNVFIPYNEWVGTDSFPPATAPVLTTAKPWETFGFSFDFNDLYPASVAQTLINPISFGSRFGTIRCDNGASLSGGYGCVNPYFYPTFSVSAAAGSSVQLAAQAIADMQTDVVPFQSFFYPTSGQGVVGHTPLQRVDPATATFNRNNRACKYFVTYPRPTWMLPNNPNQDSCDEYPFASTQNSTNGYTNARHVPLGQNSLVGSQLSAFNQQMRVLAVDGWFDYYWVTVTH